MRTKVLLKSQIFLALFHDPSQYPFPQVCRGEDGKDLHFDSASDTELFLERMRRLDPEAKYSMGVIDGQVDIWMWL